MSLRKRTLWVLVIAAVLTVVAWKTGFLGLFAPLRGVPIHTIIQLHIVLFFALVVCNTLVFFFIPPLVGLLLEIPQIWRDFKHAKRWQQLACMSLLFFATGAIVAWFGNGWPVQIFDLGQWWKCTASLLCAASVVCFIASRYSRSRLITTDNGTIRLSN